MTAGIVGKLIADKPMAPTPRPRMGVGPVMDPRTINSSDLLLGQSTVLIEHMGEIYRLQTTRQGKLIMTK